MPDSYPAAQSSLSFAKLVATPTETTWSQAYNAGNLFACVALTAIASSEEISLQTLGKDIFPALQSEFFALEEKDTTHIKQALTTSLEKIPQEISPYITLAFFNENTLHIFIAGGGKVVMKRDDKIGVLLQKEATDIVISASGFLNNGDILILQTGPFAQGIASEVVQNALDLNLPTDIVEALSPTVHEQDNGGQAAIVITYRGAGGVRPETMAAEAIPQETNETLQDQTLAALYQSEEPQENPPMQENKKPKLALRLPKLPHFTFSLHMSHRRKLFLSIALILFLLLGASVFFTLHKKSNDERQALFQKIYPPAKQDYETGQGLATLNPTLSQENYQKAQAILKDGETKFPTSSEQYKQLASLLTQVEGSLTAAGSGQTTATKAVEPDKNSLLQVEQANTDGLAFGQDDTDVYIITAKAISTVSKSSGAKKEIIKNDNDWSSPQAVVPYQGNVYVLDPKNGVLKFVQGSGGFGKTSYFKSGGPDLSQGTGMAIDGSVWLVLKSGIVMEYTKGTSNGIQVTGMQTPLHNPTKLVTDITMEHVYILDDGNNRIVQLDKHGAYQNAYTSPVVAQATDMDVSEKTKTIQLLSGGKVWQMNL